MRFTLLAAAIGMAAAAPATGTIYTLTYSAASCAGGCVNDGDPISELFGSNADVTVQNLRLAPGYVPVDGGLNYYNRDYSGSSAAYVEDASLETRGAVALFVNRPGTITLLSADFGGWPNAEVPIDWEVWGRFNNSVTFATGTVVTQASGLTTVNFNISAGFNQPIVLIFGPDAYNGGVQNVRYSFIGEGEGTGVPEPASWAMLIAGFGLTGAANRRRRAHVIA
ncbi:PEPxxWA-CTERM sorting domain-containing protein [Sandarakinorhabdus oryzae]|uniref:PEPxxWA-CTERM sorting domain-containing protein n=1 Tax=Sandarakinorhabdus oryzae TaxID=2675220 RepID=UPI001F2137D4|nr:PEPxxWA-CTERM sorting domain-containing protein [Sandarakinorhabdus oryzae]